MLFYSTFYEIDDYVRFAGEPIFTLQSASSSLSDRAAEQQARQGPYFRRWVRARRREHRVRRAEAVVPQLWFGPRSASRLPSVPTGWTVYVAACAGGVIGGAIVVVFHRRAVGSALESPRLVAVALLTAIAVARRRQRPQSVVTGGEGAPAEEIAPVTLPLRLRPAATGRPGRPGVRPHEEAAAPAPEPVAPESVAVLPPSGRRDTVPPPPTTDGQDVLCLAARLWCWK